MRTTIKALGLALAAALFVPAAWADHEVESERRYPDRGYGTDRDDRDYRGRDDRSGRWLQRVQILAHQTEDAASELARAARYGARRVSWRESWALRRIDSLAWQARSFHRLVEGHRRDPRQLEDDFEALDRAYEQASIAMRNLRPYSARAEFGRVSSLMGRLRTTCTGFDSPWARHRGPEGHDDRDERRYPDFPGRR